MEKVFFDFFEELNNSDEKIEHRKTYDEIIAPLYDNFSEPSPGELEFYEECIGPHSADILEIGCGSGRITVPLLKKGFSVDALDFSPNMLKILKEKISLCKIEDEKRYRLINADIFGFIPQKKYDCIIIPATTICLLVDSSERFRQLIDKIYDVLLKPEGRLCFDIRVYDDPRGISKSELNINDITIDQYPGRLFFQEFTNYLPGFTTINMYIECKTPEGIKRYLTYENKKILTFGMISKYLLNKNFLVLGTKKIGYVGGIEAQMLCFKKEKE